MIDSINSLEEFVKENKKEGINAIGILYATHNQLEQARISSVSFVDYEHHLMPWLLAAALLLLLEMLIPWRPWRRRMQPAALLALCVASPQALAQTDSKSKLVEGTQAFRANQAETAAVLFGEAAKDAEDHKP